MRDNSSYSLNSFCGGYIENQFCCTNVIAYPLSDNGTRRLNLMGQIILMITVVKVQSCIYFCQKMDRQTLG